MKNADNDVLLRADTMQGTKVYDAEARHIGQIKDLMIDTATGYVEYAVLSVDTGFLNLGNKFFAIPLRAFRILEEGKEWQLDVDKDKLEGAPGFDKDNWPTGAQTEFLSEVYRYYDVQPLDPEGQKDPVREDRKRENIETEDSDEPKQYDRPGHKDIPMP